MDETNCEWLDVTTPCDVDRVLLNTRTGERRAEPWPTVSPTMQLRIDKLLRELGDAPPPEKAGEP
jgi:hypothetical protein